MPAAAVYEAKQSAIKTFGSLASMLLLNELSTSRLLNELFYIKTAE